MKMAGIDIKFLIMIRGMIKSMILQPQLMCLMQ